MTQSERTPRELTRSVHSPADGDPDADPVYVRTRRVIMRVGNGFFILLAFALFVPLMIGVGRGIDDERVWDPYTGEPVYANQGSSEDMCLEDGRRLLIQAGRHGALERAWAEPYAEWQLRCRATHTQLYRALAKTRDELRLGAQPSP